MSSLILQGNTETNRPWIMKPKSKIYLQFLNLYCTKNTFCVRLWFLILEKKIKICREKTAMNLNSKNTFSSCVSNISAICGQKWTNLVKKAAITLQDALEPAVSSSSWYHMGPRLVGGPNQTLTGGHEVDRILMVVGTQLNWVELLRCQLDHWTFSAFSIGLW